MGCLGNEFALVKCVALGKFGCARMDVGFGAVFQCSDIFHVWDAWFANVCGAECDRTDAFWLFDAYCGEQTPRRAGVSGAVF